jgi:hypothetical protein
MKYYILFLFLFPVSFAFLQAQPYVKPDRKINQKELELAIFPGYGQRGALAGGQIIYRFPLSCMFKLGGGIHITTDENPGGSHPGLFIDLAKFVGNKQKWIFDGQMGRAFYSYEFSYPGVNGSSYYTRYNGEVFYKISASYRMNAGKKLTFFTGPYFFLQTFGTTTEVKDGMGQPLNPVKTRQKDGSGGLRIGFVF